MLRPATADDAPLLFEWANDPVTRSQSFNTDEIEWAGHVAWLQRVLDDSARVIWLRLDPHPVASIRFEAREARALVSVQVAPEARGRGYGTAIVAEASALYASATGRVIDAEIKPDNAASIRSFEASGYRRLVDADDGSLRFEFRPL